MKTLFDPAEVEATKQRILTLHRDSQRQWGTMGVTRTLAHCTSGLQMAMGEIKPKRAPFPFSLIGLLIKPLVFREKSQMRRNSPSAPELFVPEPEACNFSDERTKLISTLERFATGGPAVCTDYPHPFFGPLTPQQWAILMYQHTDHHLRQFGV